MTGCSLAVADFLEHGRRVKAGGALAVNATQRRPVPRIDPSPADVREWAACQGIAVSARGRVSADIVAQYEAAQG